jgi:hypothetical protein
VNTSVIRIDFDARNCEADSVIIKNGVARNKRRLFLFDARRMLLLVMCADWCRVVWPYVLTKRDINDMAAPDNVETLLAEYLEVVAERRRRN